MMCTNFRNIFVHFIIAMIPASKIRACSAIRGMNKWQLRVASSKNANKSSWDPPWESPRRERATKTSKMLSTAATLLFTISPLASPSSLEVQLISKKDLMHVTPLIRSTLIGRHKTKGSVKVFTFQFVFIHFTFYLCLLTYIQRLLKFLQIIPIQFWIKKYSSIIKDCINFLWYFSIKVLVSMMKTSIRISNVWGRTFSRLKIFWPNWLMSPAPGEKGRRRKSPTAVQL